MAETRGQDILLDFKIKGAAAWLTLICLRQPTFDVAVTEITTSNRCRGNKSAYLPGTTSYTIAFEGDIDLEPTAVQAGANEVNAWIKDGEDIEFRMYNADQSYYRAGEGFFTAESEVFPQEGVATFSGTLRGSGDWDNVAPAT